MKLLNFKFDKIYAEKFSSNFKNLSIDNDISILNLKLLSRSSSKKDDLLMVEFASNLDYSPNLAKMELKGNLIISDIEENVNEILKEWELKQSIKKSNLNLFNIIFKKSTLKFLELEEELNLPLHIKLPSFKSK